MELAQGIAILGKALGAGLCMGIGAIGPAVGEGNAETTGIYSLLIAFVIMFAL